jgi:hypothetical protein
MLGQAHAYQYISQEISNLLNNKEQKDEQEETLLTSDKSQEVPKIKLALEEKYEKEKEDKSILIILLKKKKHDKLLSTNRLENISITV